MRKTTILYTILFMLLCNLNLNAQKNQLLPAPQKVTLGEGRFMVAGVKLLVSQDLALREEKSIAQFLEFVKQRTGLSIPIINTEDPKVRLIELKSDQPGSPLPIVAEKPGQQSREAYHLRVKANKIEVNGSADAGLYYALQTLSQLVIDTSGNTYIPEVEIDDYPAFAYRGVMMDFSHGALLTENEIKKQIDFLSRWKVNQYYFYNEISIEMKGYPLMNYNACYSQEQIKRIIAYGRERHIDVIPFVNFYSHLHELLRVEKYASLGIGRYGHDLNPDNPEVQILLKDWIKQYADLFPSPFIHIGFDETWETERLVIANPKIKPKELYIKQLSFVTNTLRKYGKTVMAWTDITHNYPEIALSFPKDLIPVIWEYSDQPGSVLKWLKPIQKTGLPFFIQSAVDNWGNVYVAANYTFDNIDVCLKASREEKAIGYITSVWTDPVQALQRNAWLFMAYGSVGAWQNEPLERSDFMDKYGLLMYPGISVQMINGFKKMAESEAQLAKCLGRHTMTEMWADPFTPFHLKNTMDHLNDYKNSRLCAESAQEFFMEALSSQTADSAFIKTMLVNSRLLDYTATRFIWARTIVDRWNWIYKYKATGNKDDSRFNDINSSAHGLTADLMDFCTELREEYKQAWLSENMSYRMGTMTGRFDSEYLFWRNWYNRLVDYNKHYNINDSNLKFEDLFLKTQH